MATGRPWLWCVGVSALWALGLFPGVGCSALPPGNTLGPALAHAARQVPVEMPAIRQGEKVAVVEPFSTIRELDRGLTYIEIDEATHRQRGAWLSVNGGPWTVSAVLRRGDRVDVAYTRTPGGKPAAGTLSYTFYGPTTKGYIRLVETRWYLDGYPEERRSLRVWPYEVTRAAAARR